MAHGVNGGRAEQSIVGSNGSSSSSQKAKKAPQVGLSRRSSMQGMATPPAPTVRTKVVDCLKKRIDDILLNRPQASSVPKSKKGSKGTQPKPAQLERICKRFSDIRKLKSLSTPDGAAAFNDLYCGAWSDATLTDVKNWLVACNTRLRTMGTFRALLLVANVVEKYEGEPLDGLMKKLDSSFGQGSNAEDLQQLQAELAELIGADRDRDDAFLRSAKKDKDKEDPVARSAKTLHDLVTIVRASSEATDERAKRLQAQKLDALFFRIQSDWKKQVAADDDVQDEASVEHEGNGGRNPDEGEEADSNIAASAETGSQASPEQKGGLRKGPGANVTPVPTPVGTSPAEKDSGRKKAESKKAEKGRLVRGGSQKIIAPKKKKNNSARLSASFYQSPLSAPGLQANSGGLTPRADSDASWKSLDNPLLSTSGSATSPSSARSDLASPPATPKLSSDPGRNLLNKGEVTSLGGAEKALEALKQDGVKEAFVEAFDQGTYDTLLELAKRVKTGGRFNWRKIHDDDKDGVQQAVSDYQVQPERYSSIPVIVLDFLRSADQDLQIRSQPQPSFRLRDRQEQSGEGASGVRGYGKAPGKAEPDKQKKEQQ